MPHSKFGAMLWLAAVLPLLYLFDWLDQLGCWAHARQDRLLTKSEDLLEKYHIGEEDVK